MRSVLRLCAVALVAACAAGGLAACGDDDDDGGGGASTAGAAATTTAAGDASSGSGVDQASIDIGVDYTGGTAGKADSSLEPLKVGFVVQKGGTPSFPEQEAAADAATQFINEDLGGVDGHPIQLEKCYIQSEEDGQKCGAEMLDKGVPVVHMGLAIIGNASLYKTLAPKIPVLVGSTSTGPDSTTKGVYSFTGGGPAVIYAIAKDMKNIGAKNVALVSVGNPGGKFTMEKIAVPALDQLQVPHSKTVYYADDATTPDIVSAVQAAGGAKADAIFFDPSTPQQCVSLWDAMKQLGIDKPVGATPICNADIFVDHTGAGPVNWRFWGFGENPRVEQPDITAYNNVMDAFGQGKWKNVGFAPSSMRDILSIAKFGNQIGFDKISPETMNQAILDFKGPAFLSPGPMSCGSPPDPATQSVCGSESVGSTFVDGAWKNIGSIKVGLTS